ncbi:MAG: FN3 and LamG domain-containing metallophosphoesterase [Treponema sp.]|nr:FN3 and LamG domain-containing metallophosphoesterase [Treponema sp.]
MQKFSYQVSAADPDKGDVTYVLYVAPGAHDSASGIMQAGTKTTLSAETMSGEIPGTAGAVYSACVEAYLTAREANDRYHIVSAPRQVTLSPFTQAPALSFTTGSSDGKLAYSWTDSSPAADTYELYVAAGQLADAAAVVSSGQKVDTGSEKSGDFSGTAGAWYSAVLKAIKDDVSIYSAIQTARAYNTAAFDAAPALSFTTGSSDGKLAYSWTDSIPAADTYELYVAAGQLADAAAVVSSGQKVDTGSAKSGEFNGTKGAWYSAVLKAIKDDGSVYSAIQTAQAYDSGSADLIFGVISDTHVGATSRGASTWPNINRLEKVLDWYNQHTEASTLAIVGDITDGGTVSQWNQVKASIAAHKGDLRIVAVMGNHDAYTGASSTNYTAAQNFEDGTGQQTNADYVINGYHFIVLNGGRSGAITENYYPDGAPRTPGESANSADESNLFYAAIHNWAMARIAAAETEDPNKPIFVFIHHPLKNTFYVSDEWYTATFGAGAAGELNSHPQVVVFGGHIHSPNSDPRSIWQYGFTSVNTVSTHYMEMETGNGYGGTKLFLGDNGTGTGTSSCPKHPVPRSDASGSYSSGPRGQGMLISVTGSKVKIENWDFNLSQGDTYLQDAPEKIPQTWEFDVSKPAEFPYTEAKWAQRKRNPEFPSGASNNITISSTSDTSVTVTFPQATIPAPNDGQDVVHHYKFEFINKDKNDKVDRTAYQWSDFMDTPSLQKSTYTQLIGGLKAGTNYELRIWAFSSLGGESAAYISKTFTTTGEATPKGYILSFNGNKNNAYATPGTLSMTGTETYVTAAPGVQAIVLGADTGRSEQRYINLGKDMDMNENFTIAFWAKFIQQGGRDYNPIFGSGKWSGTNTGLFIDLRKTTAAESTLQVTAQSNANWQNKTVIAAPTVGKDWQHIAVVVEGNGTASGAITTYLNGTKVTGASTTGLNLTIGLSGTDAILGNARSSSDSDTYSSAAQAPTTYIRDFYFVPAVWSAGEVAAKAVTSWSATPTTANASVVRTSATQAICTLNNSPAYANNQTWKVYTTEDGNTLASGVSASNTGNTLTLTASGGLSADKYYVSVTESDKTESGRLEITVMDGPVGYILSFNGNLTNTAPNPGPVTAAGANAASLEYVDGRAGSSGPKAVHINYDRYIDLGTDFDYSGTT